MFEIATLIEVHSYSRSMQHFFYILAYVIGTCTGSSNRKSLKNKRQEQISVDAMARSLNQAESLKSVHALQCRRAGKRFFSASE